MPDVDWLALSPVIALTVGAVILLLLVVAVPRARGAIYALVALAALLVALVLVLLQFGRAPVTTFSGAWRTSDFSLFFSMTIIVSAILGVMISDSWLRLHRLGEPEYYTVLLCATIGMIVAASAYDLTTLFLGIELMSIPTYVLTGFAKHHRPSNEAAMKYFLLGAFSTAVLLYGLAWTYGVTGETNYAAIGRYIMATGNRPTVAILLAIFLVTAGLGFKVAMVPFHMWTPDAYQGAPTVVTAFMSVSVKAGGFAAFVRLFVVAFGALHASWAPALIVLSILTMLLGNLAAITQYDVKRMLAYSSIGHTGFMLVGLATWGPNNPLGVSSVAFYAFAYVFMNLGAFGILAWLENHGGGTTLDHLSGLFAKAPAAALAMSVFMLSLMGFPLTVGLPAKIFVFESAAAGGYVWLAVVGLIISAVAAVFYLRVMVRMFMYEPRLAIASPRQPMMVAGLAAAVAGTIVFGIAFSPVFDLAQHAALHL